MASGQQAAAAPRAIARHSSPSPSKKADTAKPVRRYPPLSVAIRPTGVRACSRNMLVDVTWRRGLSSSESEDATQDVVLLLAQKLGTFYYDRSRSSRGWLRTLTQSAVVDFLADRKRQ